MNKSFPWRSPIDRRQFLSQSALGFRALSTTALFSPQSSLATFDDRSRAEGKFHEILQAAKYYTESHGDFFPHDPRDLDAFDTEGRPFLSWRVQLLPFLDQADLYGEFHHEEPWDSEHNIQLLERMPDVFLMDEASELEPGMTRIVRADGEETLFANGVGAGLSDVRDGLSNTIYCFAVGREHAVPWTKPADLVIDFEQPIFPQFALPEGEDSLVGMCDGTVRFIPATVDEETVLMLILPNDGGVLQLP